jgi:tetratricopeptide (TPR) repeat protein
LNSVRFFAVLLAGLLSGASCAAAEPVLKSAGIAHSDTSYQYLSSKGTQAYKRGNLARAAKYFEDALKAAKEEKIEDDRLALLKTNLAATYRDEERYPEATALFDEAVDIERKQVLKDTRAIAYTAQQYAALLRNTNKDLCADYILEAAKHNFTFNGKMPAVSIASANSDENESEVIATQSTSSKQNKTQSLFDDRVDHDRNSYWNTPARESVTAQLRELAEIERIYAEQSRLASTPIAPSMEGGFFGSYLPNFTSTYTMSTFYPPLISSPVQSVPIAPLSHSFGHHGGGFGHGGHFGR